MRYKVCLAFTLMAFVIVGRAPGIRELRNPDAEHGAGVRTVIALKRGVL